MRAVTGLIELKDLAQISLIRIKYRLDSSLE